MIVEQALRGVQNVRLGMAQLGQPIQHILEVRQIGFIGADVLCGVDRIELDAEAALAPSESGAVNIRQYHQLLVLLEVGKRLRRIGKGRPVGHGRAEPLVPGRAHRHIPFLCQATMHSGE